MNLIKHNDKPQVIKGEGLYTHTIYTGEHLKINVEEGDTAWVVNDDVGDVRVIKGPEVMFVLIRL